MAGFALRLIGEQQLQHHCLRCARPPGRGRYPHPGLSLANAGRGECAFAFDFDYTCAAIAVRAITGLRVMAKVRNLDAVAVCSRPDRLPRPGFDFPPVHHQRKKLAAHASSSSGKYRNNESNGLPAAWPRPQIEAEDMAWASSRSSPVSQLGVLINVAALRVPTRHGVHWPQLSSSKKCMRLSATSRRSSWSPSTISA